MEITLDELRARFKAEHARAAERVRNYAAHRCSKVPAAEIETLCAALGDIGVNEAFDALDTRQRELAGND